MTHSDYCSVKSTPNVHCLPSHIHSFTRTRTSPGAPIEFTLNSSLRPGEPAWCNYVKGVLAQYVTDLPQNSSVQLDMYIAGTVPLGGGVSSSASLSVSVATFLEAVLEQAGVPPPQDARTKARKCRAAENDFLNTPCGIMDQFVTALAEPGHAMLLDCRSEVPKAVPLSDPNIGIVVTNSNVKHALGERGSQYPVRVAQCKAAVAELQKHHPHVEQLRDASESDLASIKGDIDSVSYKRARHVITENARCESAAAALERQDYASVGAAMLASHKSLASDYEVSIPELDTLVALAMEVEGVYGSRVTGAGFGGCTVTLARMDAVPKLIEHLQKAYKEQYNIDCDCFVTQPGSGAKMLITPESKSIDQRTFELPKMPAAQ